MKRNLLYLLAFFVLACDKDDSTNQLINDNCLLTEELSGYNGGGMNKHYYYDNENLIREEIKFNQESLNITTFYTYDEQDKITKVVSHQFGQVKDSTVLQYNSENLLAKASHYYDWEGTNQEVYVFTYEYSSPTVLKRLNISFLGFPHLYYTYEYKNGLMDKVNVYSATGTLYSIYNLQYDRRERSKNKVQDLMVQVFEYGIGFPHKRNITKLLAFSDKGELLNGHSTEASYEYNADGYTIKKTIKGMYPESETTVFDYRYSCK